MLMRWLKYELNNINMPDCVGWYGLENKEVFYIMENIGNILKKGVFIVTVGIAVACVDGVVIGADRKVTMSRGTRIKSLENKIFALSFRDGKNLLVCCAGMIDYAKRAITQINPSNFDSIGCGSYRDWAEGCITRLKWSLSERGLTYDATLLYGMIDTDSSPVIGHIMPTGLVETKYQGYFTAGVGAPYAEMVLKDSYSPAITVEDAKLIVGGLIDKIGQVDNDVEGMDVSYISSIDEQIYSLSWSERQAVTGEDKFSFDLKTNLDNVKKTIKYWDDLLENARKKAAEANPEPIREVTQ